MMKSHSWKATHQIAVEFRVELDAKILYPFWHPFLQNAREGAGSWAVLDHDISWLHGDLIDHGFTELAGTGPDGTDRAGARDESRKEMQGVAQAMRMVGKFGAGHDRWAILHEVTELMKAERIF